jgi:C4-dicarboxylate transporter DctM subunit
MISPPVGLNVFVVSGVTKVPSATIFKGILPFCLALLLVIIVLTVWPQLATWLPNIMQS